MRGFRLAAKMPGKVGDMVRAIRARRAPPKPVAKPAEKAPTAPAKVVEEEKVAATGLKKGGMVKKKSMSDKEGRAMKKTTADARGRAMPKKMMGGGMTKGYKSGGMAKKKGC